MENSLSKASIQIDRFARYAPIVLQIRTRMRIPQHSDRPRQLSPLQNQYHVSSYSYGSSQDRIRKSFPASRWSALFAGLDHRFSSFSTIYHASGPTHQSRRGGPRSPARRSNVSLLITLFDCEDPGAFSSVLFLPLSNNGLELRVCLEDLEGRTIR